MSNISKAKTDRQPSTEIMKYEFREKFAGMRYKEGVIDVNGGAL